MSATAFYIIIFQNMNRYYRTGHYCSGTAPVMDFLCHIMLNTTPLHFLFFSREGYTRGGIFFNFRPLLLCQMRKFSLYPISKWKCRNGLFCFKTMFQTNMGSTRFFRINGCQSPKPVDLFIE